MKRQFVAMLQEGDIINDYFVAIRKDLRDQSSGGKFLGMVFKDRTGEIGGVLWTNAAAVSRLFEVGDVVNVRGTVTTYQDRLQVRVDQVLPMCPGEYKYEDLVDVPADSEQKSQQLKGILDTIQNEWLKKLNGLFLDDSAFMSIFTRASAGKKWHHAQPGGLMRHCYEMARLASLMAELFPDLDRDILLTGIFLHDVGKLEEMTHDLCVDYTTAGKLIGHLEIGADMVRQKIAQIDGFPELLRLQVLHCVLSHHGELINGSPIVPKTLEAVVLYHIDNLDAQADAVARVMRETREKRLEWSDFLPLIERQIWAGEK